MSRTIGLAGTGYMGAAVTRRLLAGGERVRVWNRTAAKAQALAADGAEPVANPRALGACDVVLLVLEDGRAAADLLSGAGLAAAMRAGALVVDLGSGRPADAAANARALAERDILHVDAPLSGGPPAALAGTLAIMAGGTEDAVAQALPVLSRLGRVTRVGADGAGQAVKLANQMLVAAGIAAVAEATLLCEAAGIDPSAMREALSGGFADSRILQLHGSRMAARDFAPGGKSSSQLKDLDNALEHARAHGFDPPLTAQVRDWFAALCARGDAGMDHSALILEIARRGSSDGP